ncbi:MAG: response regulator [Steroidobacteraceae bacterium]
MARKRSLVVDDSKSARVILSRMLEKYDIEVDMAESAEQAIEYLKSNRPDAIFMDHLMPGMDGLQAVQAIKGNPQTAMIPIMMYTSQEGELYVGQARALGAMGVLPKQVRPVDVSKVLYELHLLPDRRDMTESALAPVEVEEGAAVAKAPAASAASAASARPAATVDWGRRLESAIKDQSVDVRRFIVATLDSFAARIVSDVRGSIPAPTLEFPPAPARAARSWWPWAVAMTTVCLAAGLLGAGWLQTRDELAKSRAEVAALTAANSELQHARSELSATVRDLTAALSAAAAVTGAAPANGAAGNAPFAPRVELVPYGEIPFDRARLEVLRELLTKLEAQGFHGVLKITSYAGLFCLAGNAAEGFSLAPPSLPLGKCELIGNPFEDSLSGQQRQSLAFANLIAGMRQRSGGAITVAIENAGSGRPGTPYPARAESLTAGEWNRAAAADNRVEFAAESSSGQ